MPASFSRTSHVLPVSSQVEDSHRLSWRCMLISHGTMMLQICSVKLVRISGHYFPFHMIKSPKTDDLFCQVIGAWLQFDHIARKGHRERQRWIQRGLEPYRFRSHIINTLFVQVLNMKPCVKDEPFVWSSALYDLEQPHSPTPRVPSTKDHSISS